jgi:DNA-binding CsgD family transcriptional regulator
MLAASPIGRLLERDRELGEIDRALAAAQAGDGASLLFAGVGGIGKTALLKSACERADSAGLAVFAARGSELEGEFPYGVVRQLLETVVRVAAATLRGRLLAGAAALAAPVLLEVRAEPAALAEPAFAGMHGLYWLVANLAMESPLLLVIDDAQWSDAASLRFLIYLARRLDGMAVTLIMSTRTGDGGSDPLLLGELEGNPAVMVSTPAALSVAAVARLLATEFGRSPDPDFVLACSGATGGNPFLVRELAASLIADGIEPDADAAASVATVGPKAVARATLGRLGHLSDDAIALARAIAVLAGEARLPRAAELAGIDERRTLRAFDALVAAGLVLPDGLLEFTHPIVRAAVYNEIPPGDRSAAQRRIADLLELEGAALDAIAGHLLLCQPAASPGTIAVLRDAARHALVLGAPDSAVAYLTRALGEGCDRELRTKVLLELGLAEKLAGRPAAAEHLAEVRRIAVDPLVRATATLEEVEVRLFSGDWQRAGVLLDVARAELDGDDEQLLGRTDAARTTLAAYDVRLVGDFAPRLRELRALAARDGSAARPVAMALAGIGAMRGEPLDRIRSLAERGWDDGRYLAVGIDSEMLAQAISGLIICDQLDRATVLVEAVRDAARTSGSPVGFIMATTFAASIATRRGALEEAEGELRAGCEGALEYGVQFAFPSLLWGSADVLLERPDAGDLASLVETIDIEPMADLFNGALLFEVRGRLRFAAGDRTSSIGDLRRAKAISEALGFVNPNGVASRSTLALMLAPEDREEALELIKAELADARRVGQPRAIGVALRALGTVEGSDAGRAHLEEAVNALAGSPARLEQARAQLELGAAIRRQGSRSAARELLRGALDVAARCGATQLAERALSELAATGARPRRLYATSRDALTASELRVARLAAEGLTTQQIAQMLFVTAKTIDTHLQHSYAKLGIKSRKQLATALEHDPSERGRGVRHKNNAV